MDTDNQVPEIKNAGHISTRLIAVLAEKFPPEVVAAKIEVLLNATHVTRGGQHIVDNRGVEAGLKLLLAYQVGLPVQRQEIVNFNVDGDKAIEDRMRKSPALRKAMIRKLEQMDAEPDSSPAIEMEATAEPMPVAEAAPIERPAEKINTIPDSVKVGKKGSLAGVLRRVKAAKQK